MYEYEVHVLETGKPMWETTTIGVANKSSEIIHVYQSCKRCDMWGMVGLWSNSAKCYIAVSWKGI